MTDNQEQPQAEEEQKAPEPAAEASAPASSADAKEVEEGKVFAILGYIIPILCLIPLITRNNEFSLYHGKQVLLIWIAFMVISFVNVIPCAGQIISWSFPLRSD